MRGKLIDILNRLESVDDSDGFNPLIIFAKDGSEATAAAPAIVCPGDDEGTRKCPLDPELTEVLLVFLAKEAIEVWSAWRDGRIPTPRDKFDAVMHYSRNDAYLPLSDR